MKDESINDYENRPRLSEQQLWNLKLRKTHYGKSKTARMNVSQGQESTWALAKHTEIPTWSLGGYDAVIELHFEGWHDDGAGAGAVSSSSAGQLQGPPSAPERGQGVWGIGAAQGRVRVRGVVDSDVADDIGSLLHTQTAGGTKDKIQMRNVLALPTRLQISL